ncbi:NUDIX hydrolase [Halobacillus mangrovi]|uniref:DNA mismatch repair protein MutT n=1 Tax=Halobacillus mangrovi TaxID=402384 RepID=A0A1W5ZQD6_9BACI|nr:NUDIX hydrolase [Halobacillus mangrovi]ARI75505.1 DNA mismatch repair protein MutT [Halobacillus mangrovi]
MGYVEDLRAIVGNRPLIFVGSVVIVVDDRDRVLLQQRRSPHGVWGLPGGLMELGESTEEVAKREVYEESGLIVDDLKLLNVYSGKDQFIRAENGDEFYVVTTAYFTRSFSGDMKVDPDESLQFQFISADKLPDQMIGSHRTMLKEYIINQNRKN